ncbi:ArsR/SmtB family transcription factor [Thermoflexibacter ruber]|uniref:DNA-binding transcriptional regulator, ArsR family n=1 Tax=Thermoflexibacter ruber TaxID=1003 RepID=A0A1I2HYE6_9BACT|nr:metalloregulator ArsR/SmtB family transcription factor [Thermoflexibacter ruber]SFF34360.1 DNA-binding transcriptional regulator, ArsR family [Thermoflexibacter ruber]
MQAKINNFSREQQTLSQFAKLISHPARIAIVQLLAEKKTCISGDISKEIPQLNRVTISQHLQELKNFGLIKGEIEGVKVNYCIDNEKLIEYQTLFHSFFKQIISNIQNHCC